LNRWRSLSPASSAPDFASAILSSSGELPSRLGTRFTTICSPFSCFYSGAGPIGLVSLLAARAAGAAPIVITDIAQSRLDFAKKLVPGVKTILIERGVEPKDVAAKIKAEAGLPLGISVALECTGVESSVQTAIFAAKFGSSVFVSCSLPLVALLGADPRSSLAQVIGVGKDYQSL